MKKGYRGRTFVRESSWVCGDYMDVDVFPVFQKPGRRRARCRPSSEIQARLNRRNSQRAFTRVANLNFTAADLAFHGTYAVEPEDAEAVIRDCRNFIARVNYRRKKEGLPPCKWLRSIERGAKNGRLHVHYMLSGGLDRDVLEELWGHGRANTRRLQFDEEGVAGLARYMAKDKLTFKSWSGSRNLEKPEPAQVDGQLDLDELAEMGELAEAGLGAEELEAARPGWRCVDIRAEKNNWNHAWYIRAVMVRTPPPAPMRL